LSAARRRSSRQPAFHSRTLTADGCCAFGRAAVWLALSQIGQTPLHAAAGSNRLACAQALMQRGADVNAKSNVRR
jgi:hypothetical protein